MTFAAATSKSSKSQPRATQCWPDAAEVQTAGWDLDVDLGDYRTATGDPIHLPLPDLRRQGDIINLSALMAYLRLYQDPDDGAVQPPAAGECLVRGEALACMCCGAPASLDEVGFCVACAKVAEPA